MQNEIETNDFNPHFDLLAAYLRVKQLKCVYRYVPGGDAQCATFC